MDDRLALGDLAAFAVDRDKDRLVERIGQQCRQVLFAAAAGVAGLPLPETGVQRRPARAHLVIVLVLGDMSCRGSPSLFAPSEANRPPSEHSLTAPGIGPLSR